MNQGRSSILGLVMCLFGLAVLSFYSARTGSATVDTIPEIKASTTSAVGREVALTSDVRVARLLDRGFVARQNGVEMEARHSPEVAAKRNVTKPDLAEGDYVSLKGVYREPGYLEIRDFHVHKGRRLKIWISLGALVALSAIVIVQFREGNHA